MPKGVMVYGQSVRKIREDRFLTREEFAKEIGTGISNIERIESKHIAGMGLTAYRGLTEFLKRSPGGAPERLLVEDDEGNKAEFDVNVVPFSEQPVPEIPLFDLPLAAGNWTEVTERCEVFKQEQIDDGRFRVRLSGDSMQPVYKDGEVIEFRCLRPDKDGPVEGKDYYVQRNDGYATFKRVEKVGEQELVLRPLNKKKYPDAMPVARQEVVRMARAVGKFESID